MAKKKTRKSKTKKKKSTPAQRKIGFFFFFSLFIVLAILYDIAYPDVEVLPRKVVRCECHIYDKYPEEGNARWVYEGITEEECRMKEVELFNTKGVKEDGDYWGSEIKNCR